MATTAHAYGTQSDAYAAENDVIPRTSEKGRKVSLGKAPSEGALNDSDDLLAAMGYKSELVRSRSTLQVAFMSFVLASIPYGLATTLYYPVVNGGPVTIIWGWLAVSLIILCVAASLGEITSVYPTSGGVYYQTFMLAAPSYRKIASWICGWCFVVGNITITLSVNFATALFYVACINVFTDAEGNGIFAGTTWQVYLIFLGVTLLCNVVCVYANKWLPWLDVRSPLQNNMRICYLPSVDLCHFLDICRCHRHRCVRACHCEERTPQRRLRFYHTRHLSLWMDPWMVVHGRTSSRSLRNLFDRNDCFVSMPFTSARATRSPCPSTSYPMQSSNAALPQQPPSCYPSDFSFPLRHMLQKDMVISKR